MIILRRLPNIFTAELSSSFFQAAKVGNIKGIEITVAWIDKNVEPFSALIPAYLKEIQEYLARFGRRILI